MQDFRIVSWNVNGIRACWRKGLGAWLQQESADVVALQEVRARREQVPSELRQSKRWHSHWTAAARPGYSGVGLLSRQAPTALVEGLGIDAFDLEGRLHIATFGPLWVVNSYFPNGNGKARDNSRVPYKLEYYQALFAHLQPQLQAGRPVIVAGDFNTAHTSIDLARPKANTNTSGFLPEERAELDRWIAAGWVDTFRVYESGPGHYSWWSQRSGARARNVGWRIDYLLASPAAATHLHTAAIHPEVLGSDHCPVSAQFSQRVFACE